MTNTERRDSGMLYITDDAVMEEQAVARRLCQKLNTMDRSDFKGIQEVAKELLGKSDGAWINPPFYCDYGKKIEVGRNTFINYNCTILDVARVRIGDYCQIAPNVSIYTAGHPVHPAARNTLYEYGIEITIGNNVWIGGNVVICPGVHIGDNTVMIRRITEEDLKTYYRGVPVDEEARANMQQLWAQNTDPVKYPSSPSPCR